eukprot:COSAG05_NODE_39_length_27555_cov_750.282925_24_plen_166_part_00
MIAGTCSRHAWLPIPPIRVMSQLPENNKCLKICAILSYNLSTVRSTIFAVTLALPCQILSQRSILTAAPRAPAGPGPCLALVRARARFRVRRARAASCPPHHVAWPLEPFWQASIQAGSPSCMHGCMHGISLRAPAEPGSARARTRARQGPGPAGARGAAVRIDF